MMIEIWRDKDYKYEVELIERKPVIEECKVIEWMERYKVFNQTKIEK